MMPNPDARMGIRIIAFRQETGVSWNGSTVEAAVEVRSARVQELHRPVEIGSRAQPGPTDQISRSFKENKQTRVAAG